MLLLIDYLRKQLKMTAAQLDEFIQNERERLKQLLLGLPLYTGHAEEHAHLIFDNLSRKAAGKLNVNHGGVETSLEQFLYSKYGLFLRKPDYPCLVYRVGFFGLDHYYPLEFIYTDTK